MLDDHDGENPREDFRGKKKVLNSEYLGTQRNRNLGTKKDLWNINCLVVKFTVCGLVKMSRHDELIKSYALTTCILCCPLSVGVIT